MPAFSTGRWRFLWPITFTLFTAYSWYWTMRPRVQLSTSVNFAPAITSNAATASQPTTATGTNPSATTPSPAPSATIPKRFTIKKIYWSGFYTGSNFQGFPLDHNGNSDAFQLLFAFVGPTFRVADRALVVNAVVTDGTSWTSIEDNVMTCPGGWDANQDDRAVEIVNHLHQPVFQLVNLPMAGKNVLGGVAGAFRLDNGVIVIVAPLGLVTTADAQAAKQWIAKFRPIFKYPSERFPGKRAELPPAPPTTQK